MVEPFLPAMDVGSTPKEIVYKKNVFGFKLLHYRTNVGPHNKKLLIIPHIVNRPYILDLHHGVSVVERFCEDGFDVFMIDWGYSGSRHSEISFRDYVDFVEVAVDTISTGSVGLLGYCTGGIIGLCYTALHSDEVENLILLATPVDYSMLEDPRIFAVRAFDWIPLKEIFENVPGELVNLFGSGLLTLYFPMFSTNVEFLAEYIDPQYAAQVWRVWRWLCDAPALPGRAYSELINGCYLKNQLMKNEFRIGPAQVILNNIKCRLMNIAARYDHLIPEASVTALKRVYSGDEYRQIIFSSSHVGLSIGSRAHKELWPLVSGWAKR